MADVDLITFEEQVYGAVLIFFLLRFCFSIYALSLGVPLFELEANITAPLLTPTGQECDYVISLWLIIYGALGLFSFVYTCGYMCAAEVLETTERFRTLDSFVAFHRLIMLVDFGWLVYGYYLYWGNQLNSCYTERNAGVATVLGYSFWSFICYSPLLLFFIIKELPNPLSPYVQFIRKCPRCGEAIEKTAGCDRVRCVRCHRDFDWFYAPKIKRTELPQRRCQFSLFSIWFNRLRRRRPGNTTPFSSDCGHREAVILPDITAEVLEFVNMLKAKSEQNNNEEERKARSENLTEESQCEICFAKNKEWSLSCGHQFCSECVVKIIETNKICPMDREIVNQKTPKPVVASAEV